jgi:hypothetical protein
VRAHGVGGSIAVKGWGFVERLPHERMQKLQLPPYSAKSLRDGRRVYSGPGTVACTGTSGQQIHRGEASRQRCKLEGHSGIATLVAGARGLLARVQATIQAAYAAALSSVAACAAQARSRMQVQARWRGGVAVGVHRQRIRTLRMSSPGCATPSRSTIRSLRTG